MTHFVHCSSILSVKHFSGLCNLQNFLMETFFVRIKSMTSITPKDYCSSWRNQMRYGGPAALMPYIGIMETVLEASMHFDNIVKISLQQ